MNAILQLISEESINEEEIDNIKKSIHSIRKILTEYPSLFDESFDLRIFLESGALSVLSNITDTEPEGHRVPPHHSKDLAVPVRNTYLITKLYIKEIPSISKYTTKHL